jgi:ribosomal protein S12 methylthiotransferase accessory factor
MGNIDLLRNIMEEGSTSRTPKLPSGRSLAPEETLERIRHLMPAAGITRVADVTGLDSIGIPVVMVVRPNARSLSVSQGKGLGLAAAKVSGIMESLECFHAERVAEPIHMVRHADLIAGGKDVVDPYSLPRLATSLFRSEITIPWVEALDLRNGRARLVPLEIVSTDFSFPGIPGSGFFGRGTNGLASGNSIHEALLHGFCEVIERDAWALWLASCGATGSTIDLSNEIDPRIVHLLAQFKTANCSVLVEEITTDMMVPVFLVRLTGGSHGSPVTEAPAGGLGCHPDANLALLRALCEAAQSRLTRIAGSRDDLVPSHYRDHNHALVAQSSKAISVKRSEGIHKDTIEEDLAWVEEKLAACGMGERLVINLTRDDMKLPVVKIIVPGLEAPPEIRCKPGKRAMRYRREEV